MNVRRIPAEPDPATAKAALLTAMSGIRESSTALPDDALRTATAAGDWVSAGVLPAPENGMILYVHGGGFEHRMPDLINLLAYHFSTATGRPVFAAHYRLAPADPFPAALDDVVATYRRLLGQGVPADRIAMIGESSGGALTLSALQVLKASALPLPATVITFSSVTDMAIESPSVDTNTAGDVGIDRAMLTRLITQYLGGAPAAGSPQSPMHTDLSGLPPLLMLAGADEALLDDTLRYAKAADAAGATVEVDVYEAMPHAFQIAAMVPNNPTGLRILERVASWLATGPMSLT
jgi:monoterpene epsilon-lactone hydrolase